MPPLHSTPTRWRRNDFSTLLGILFAFSMIGIAIALGSNAMGFLDLHAALIVICGTFAVSAACYSFGDVIQAYRVVAKIVMIQSHDLSSTAIRALELADISNKKGILDLDKHLHLVRHSRFLRDGLDMVIDGYKLQELERALHFEMHAMQERFSKSVAVLKKSADVAPAMGLIGTLIGLVQMMATLQDPSAIGPAMSVALLTTFYGAVTAYLIFTPLATKTERHSQNETQIAQIYYHALCSIVKREHPRQLEVVINSILPVTQRVHFFTHREGEKAKE